MAPWVFVPYRGPWQALRRGPADDRSWYCLCLGLPAIVLFTLVPLWGDRGLPHWQMPGWLLLYPVLGEIWRATRCCARARAAGRLRRR